MDDTLADRAPAKERAYVPPPVNGDFYKIADFWIPESGRSSSACATSWRQRSRPSLKTIGQGQVPHEIIPKLAALDVNIAGVGYQGYGAAGGSGC